MNVAAELHVKAVSQRVPVTGFHKVGHVTDKRLRRGVALMLCDSPASDPSLSLGGRRFARPKFKLLLARVQSAARSARD